MATSLLERTGLKAEVVALGRPAFDLADRDAVLAGLKAARPTSWSTPPPIPRWTKLRRKRRSRSASTAKAQAMWPKPRRGWRPLLHLSTDYVFDGKLDRPYREDDPTAPAGAYGRSKLAGEKLIAERCQDSVILRTAWVYSPFGANFVRTMLRLNETRDEVGVVADQRGNPTSALDIADALIAIAGRVKDDASPALRGVFHMTGSGEATWADFAEAVFREAAARGRRLTRVKPIATADYPPRPEAGQLPPRQRKAQSRIRLQAAGRRQSVAVCCARLLP